MVWNRAGSQIRPVFWLLALFLCACNEDSAPAPRSIPPPLVTPFTGDIPVTAAWVLKDYSPLTRVPPAAPISHPLVNATLDFALGQWTPGYIEVAAPGTLAGAKRITVSYELTGDSPVLDPHTAEGNNCPGNGAVSLFLHHRGDAVMAIATYRQWSSMQDLTLGTHELAADLTSDAWVNVNGQQGGLQDTLGDLASLGFGLGGGCFRAHGIILRSGSARFSLTRYNIQ